jgi:hypothetical protein
MKHIASWSVMCLLLSVPGGASAQEVSEREIQEVVETELRQVEYFNPTRCQEDPAAYIKLIRELYLPQMALDLKEPPDPSLKESFERAKAEARRNQALAQQLHTLDVVKFCKCSYERFQKASIRDDMITGAWLSKKQEIVITCVEKNLK